ncbi:nucleotidyltransferase family protein [Sulfitobacter guttiformis]|uniref:CTP:molybdopterin cytidylyltransferase MocA n=1 Tax=Sulfitobacter guttiformis TaxID=74349 RepID=A0A420DIF7_9RHOB|nr:nucleotidyltransferase family protein [Sulfitobacter guttiformis]KIN72246.1 4-diphosphocytidyl-2C-methyl-D-erythritol synthase [Sulfitobacter guttiformis KCTC 32187]RKE93985.1 CTP:molybdopterin cytidylyltransferase MocA [Sulfitobacter guttiformis]
MSSVAIIVLAAGSSSRMRGRDKLMEEVEGKPLLRRTVQRALGHGAQVVVALPCAPHPRYEALAGLGVVSVPVANAAEGMNASLRAGLHAIDADVQAVMVLLADMPDITAQDIAAVLQAVDSEGETRIWRGTTASGDAGHPVVFHHSVIPQLAALQGDGGGSEVVKQYRDRTAYIPLEASRARTDLDTPEAWDAWRKAQSLS